MAEITDVSNTVIKFLQSTLGAKDVKIIKVLKKGNAWETEAEVYEESSFIKSLGLPTRVMDRNYYTVTLNENMSIEFYKRKERGEQEE
ncbi:MAG: hypothetical protein M0Q21_13265 [Ignavibacteriaceae bacterium]|nr:hypothetical protein [Ignavibacteriaceae bacterium]